MHATCPAHLILLDLLFNSVLYLITLMIFGEEYKQRSTSICNFLQPPVTSPFLGPNIFLCTLFLNTLNLRLLKYTMRQNSKSTYQGQRSCVPGVLKTSMMAWIPATTRLLFDIVQDILSLRACTFVTSNTLLSFSNTCKQDHILANHLHSQMGQGLFYSPTKKPMVPI
jgi:hypothetical protein